MKALLLAAGRSRRVKPVEDKNFLRFCGKFLIEHQLQALSRAGFKEVIVVGGAHNLERLRAVCGEATVVEQKDLEAGMAGAVLAARDHLGNDPVAIISGNDVVDESAYAALFAALDSNADSVLLAKEVSEYFPGGYLRVDAENRVLDIVEKPGAGNEPSNLVNIVLHGHRNPAALFSTLDQAHSDRDDRYEAALNGLIKSGAVVRAVPYNGFWSAIKFPWHVLAVARYFLEKMPTAAAIDPSAVVEEGARLVGNVSLAANVRVMAGATLVGPAYIGRDSVVATNALVRESTVGEKCVVGYSTEVARSILGDDVWTHSNYLGDSVIGDDVTFGAGTVTGNLRLDAASVPVGVGEEKVDSGMAKLGLLTGDHIRVGINVSFMPGIKIGSHSVVGAGVTVNADIPEKSYARGTVTLEISPNRNA